MHVFEPLPDQQDTIMLLGAGGTKNKDLLHLVNSFHCAMRRLLRDKRRNEKDDEIDAIVINDTMVSNQMGSLQQNKSMKQMAAKGVHKNLDAVFKNGGGGDGEGEEEAGEEGNDNGHTYL